MTKKDIIVSSLIYGSIGDAYGACFEGKTGTGSVRIEDIESPFITDDTQLTLATCEAIIENKSIDPEKIALKFTEWFHENKITGIGASTFKALQELSMGGHWALVGRKGEMAAGNGAAMRIAPLSFLLDLDDDFNKVLIRDICRITHHNDEAYLGALSLIYAIQHCFFYKNHLNKKHTFKYIIDKLPDSQIRDRLSIISEENDYAGIPLIGTKYGCTGFVVDSVPLAIYASTMMNQMSFNAILNEIISLGGDTDTISSMTMQILGVNIGVNDEVMRYFKRIQNNECIFSTFNKFADYCILNTKR